MTLHDLISILTLAAVVYVYLEQRAHAARLTSVLHSIRDLLAGIVHNEQIGRNDQK